MTLTENRDPDLFHSGGNQQVDNPKDPFQDANAYLEMLLCLQENQTVLAPQLLVLLLQFDDVVLGYGKLHTFTRRVKPGPSCDRTLNYNVHMLHSPPL